MKGSDERNFIKNAIAIWRTEDLISYWLADLETRVKKDRAVKLSVSFTGLSAYLAHPINLFLKGESGIGKTYNTTETLRYFPDEDIWFLGGMSRKSLIHSYGVLLNEYGEEIDLEDRPERPRKKDYDGNDETFNDVLAQYKNEVKKYHEELRKSYTLVDLSRKILVFLESPDYETFMMLRPILSHDKEEIEYRFVDKTSRGQLQTRRVIVKGWPAAIFLTSDNKYMEELATRSFTATPECTEIKILEANVLTNMKASIPWRYTEETQSFQIIQRLIGQLKQLSEGKIDVVIPFMNLYELFPRDISRDMRDFQHFIQFLKTVTLLHFFQRAYMKMGDKKLLICSLNDVEKALDIYREVFETTRTGTEKKLLDFYHALVKTRDAWYLENLTAEYNKTAKKKLSEESIRVMLQRLDRINYVDTKKDKEDNRKNLYVPLIRKEEKDKNLLETGSWLESKAKLEKGFESWKRNILEGTSFYYYKNISEEEGTWGEEEISIEELNDAIIGCQKTFSSVVKPEVSRIFDNEDLKPKTEIKPETSQKPDSSLNLDNSKGLGIPCPYCKARGKPMFFSCDHDLCAHVLAFHEPGDYVR